MYGPDLMSGFFLTVFVIMFVCILVYYLKKYYTIKRLMLLQARKHQGVVSGSYLLPQLKFSYKNLPVMVTSVPGSENDFSRTEVNITLFRAPPADISIRGKSFGSSLGKKLSSRVIELGSKEFDSKFTIKSEDECFVRRFLSPHIQDTLLKQIKLKPKLSIEGTWMTVSTPQVIRTEGEYDELIAVACMLVDRLQEL